MSGVQQQLLRGLYRNGPNILPDNLIYSVIMISELVRTNPYESTSTFGRATDMLRKFVTRQRSLSWTKIIIASAIGVLGGVYVWKPFFESLDTERYKKIKEE